jgi:type IV secretory pathway protease TraF
MTPALLPGDWLLVDPTVRRWPRRGSIVVVREPESDLFVIKRVAARPGDPVEVGVDAAGLALADAEAAPTRTIRLAWDEAWLVGDAPGSHDSRHYGPVTLDRLVARAWFRYGPIGRIGLLR